MASSIWHNPEQKTCWPSNSSHSFTRGNSVRRFAILFSALADMRFSCIAILLSGFLRWFVTAYQPPHNGEHREGRPAREESPNRQRGEQCQAACQTEPRDNR